MTGPTFFQNFHVAIFSQFFLFLVCQGIHAQDQNAIDTFETIINNKKSVDLICKDLNTLGGHYFNKNELENAAYVMNKFMEFARESTCQNGIYDAYNLAVSLALRENDKSKARALAKESMVEAVKTSHEYGTHVAYFLLLRIVYTEGNMDSVIILSKKVLDAKYTKYDSIYFPKFNAMLGNAYYKLGDLKNANESYLKALSIAEITGNESIQSVCIGNLGIINKELQDYREAIKYYNKALALRIKNNQKQDIAGTYVGLASCYIDMQMSDSAVFLYKKLWICSSS